MFPLIARLSMDREMEIRRQVAMRRPDEFVKLHENTGPRFPESKPALRLPAWLSRRPRKECADCC